MTTYIGDALLLLIVGGLVYVGWYLPRRRRVEEARRELAHLREASVRRV